MDTQTQMIKVLENGKTQMIKVLENGTTQNSNNTTNSYNKAFNLNFFLNETCKDTHPNCVKSASRYSDQYNKIIMEAMGGRGDNDFEKEEKIIKRVSKEVIV